ncbi:MAG: 5'/3'-nucleotidase SurE [Patescibacteria group bacterium]
MKKRILITGDDGYKSIGVRLLAKILVPEYEVTIVATKEQRSGVGGGTKAYGTKTWGKDKVENVDAYWVDGNPADAMEFAQGLFPNKFDCVVSGINWGENIGLSTITASGTGGAAIRSLAVNLAPHAVIMSLLLGTQDTTWTNDTSQQSIESFISYPGDSAAFILQQAFENDFWKRPFVNVNFPVLPTKEYRLTTLVPDLSLYYKYPVHFNGNQYSYDEQVYAFQGKPDCDISVDVGALWNGYISVTPFQIG